MDEEKKIKLLVVEDDYFLRYLLGEEAVHSGFQVQSVETAEDALIKMREEKPDLVLLDLMLPHVDGLTLLQTIKTDKKLKDIRCVIFTNVDDDKRREEALKLGAEGYLIKVEHTPGDIISKLEQFL